MRQPWYNPSSLAAIPWKPARSRRRRSYIVAQDWFCGLGGTAQALMAAGVQVAVAGNHDPLAIDVHRTNFPGVEHVKADIRGVDLNLFPATDIGVFTSECTFITRANPESADNGQLLLWDDIEPDEETVAERSRSLMKEVLRFSAHFQYAIVFVENVIDIFRWKNFGWWLGEMRKLGYLDFSIIFNSQFASPYPFPVPQSRERYYGVFVNPQKVSRMPDLSICPPAYCQHCDQRIAAVQSWKNPSRRWGRWNESYVYRCPRCQAEVRPFFYPAATAIDFDLPTIAIGERAEHKRKPLVETTLERIRIGIERYGSPLIVETVYTHKNNKPEGRVRPAEQEPIPPLTTRQSLALAVPPFPFMVDLRGTKPNQIAFSARPLGEPVSTICASGAHHMLVVPPKAEGAFTVQYYGTGTATPVTEPIPTLPSRDKHLLVMQGATPRFEDWRTRMLDPDRELKVMMGFPSSYILKGTKREKTGLIGRSLNPAIVTEILRRCIAVL